MNKLDQYQRRLEDVNLKIKLWKESKTKIVDFVYTQTKYYDDGRIDDIKFNSNVNSYLQGKDLSYWVHNHNENIRRAYHIKTKLERNIYLENNKRTITVFAIVAMLFLVSFGLFNKPEITGRVVSGGETYIQNLDVLLNESGSINGSLNQNISSLRITGKIFGGGRVVGYLDEKIIIHSILLSDSGLSSITGNVVSDLLENNTLIINEENSTLNEEILDETLNETLDVEDIIGNTTIIIKEDNQTIYELNITEEILDLNVTGEKEVEAVNTTDDIEQFQNNTLNIPLHVEENLTIENITFEIDENISQIVDNITERINETIEEILITEFVNECVGTCVLENYPKYIQIRLELEEGTSIYIESITYGVIDITTDGEENQTDETINETIIELENITINVTDNVSINLTNISLNISDLNLTNISLNLTNISINLTNITLNITNISINITELNLTNITLNETVNLTNISLMENISYYIETSYKITYEEQVVLDDLNNSGYMTYFNRTEFGFDLNLRKENNKIEILGLKNLTDIKEIYFGEINDEKIFSEIIYINNMTADNIKLILSLNNKVSNLLRCEIFEFENLACRNWIKSNKYYETNSTHMWISLSEFETYAGSYVHNEKKNYLTPVSMANTYYCPGCEKEYQCNPEGFCPMYNHYLENDNFETQFDFDIYGLDSENLLNAKICAYQFYSWNNDLITNYITEIPVSSCSNVTQRFDVGSTNHYSLITKKNDWNCIDITELIKGRIEDTNSNMFVSWVGNDVEGQRGPFACFSGYTDLSNCGDETLSGSGDCRPYVELIYE